MSKIIHTADQALKLAFNPETNAFKMEANLSLNANEDSVTSLRPSVNIKVEAQQEVIIEVFNSCTVYCENDCIVEIQPMEGAPFFQKAIASKGVTKLDIAGFKLKTNSSAYICLRG